jgi:hypothetical protein
MNLRACAARSRPCCHGSRQTASAVAKRWEITAVEKLSNVSGPV